MKTSGTRRRNLSDSEPVSCERVRVMLDVTDVLVSPSSVVTKLCDGLSCCSDWDFVEPQSFLFQKACSFLYSYAERDVV